MGIKPPNYTQTPNIIFDKWLPYLREAELKVLLVIIRKTFGYHKNKDRISISQLEQFSGLSRSRVILASDMLAEKNIISKTVTGTAGKQMTFYEIILDAPEKIKRKPITQNTNSAKTIPPCSDSGVVQILNWGGSDSEPTKETNTKERKQTISKDIVNKAGEPFPTGTSPETPLYAQEACLKSKPTKRKKSVSDKSSNHLPVGVINKKEVQHLDSSKLRVRQYTYLKQSEYEKLLKSFGYERAIILIDVYDDYKHNAKDTTTFKSDYRRMIQPINLEKARKHPCWEGAFTTRMGLERTLDKIKNGLYKIEDIVEVVD